MLPIRKFEDILKYMIPMLPNSVIKKKKRKKLKYVQQ